MRHRGGGGGGLTGAVQHSTHAPCLTTVRSGACEQAAKQAVLHHGATPSELVIVQAELRHQRIDFLLGQVQPQGHNGTFESHGRHAAICAAARTGTLGEEVVQVVGGQSAGATQLHVLALQGHQVHYDRWVGPLRAEPAAT